MTDGNNQRRQPRFETRRRLWCEGQQEQSRFGETQNISQGGMFIVAEDGAEIGEHVKLSFEEGDEKISLEVEVMWAGEQSPGGAKGVGVRIVDFGSSKDVYERFVQKLETEHSEKDSKPASSEAGDSRTTKPPATSTPPESA